MLNEKFIESEENYMDYLDGAEYPGIYDEEDIKEIEENLKRIEREI